MIWIFLRILLLISFFFSVRFGKRVKALSKHGGLAFIILAIGGWIVIIQPTFVFLVLQKQLFFYLNIEQPKPRLRQQQKILQGMHLKGIQTCFKSSEWEFSWQSSKKSIQPRRTSLQTQWQGLENRFMALKALQEELLMKYRAFKARAWFPRIR